MPMWERIRSHSHRSIRSDDQPNTSSSSGTDLRRPSSPTLNPYGRHSRSDAPQGAGRRHSHTSPASSYRSPSPSPDHRSADALGLHVLYQPPSPAPIDIIFVHGLGGASHKTWSKSQDPNLYWPQQWLPVEPEICKTRIFSFGYNASFRLGSPKTISNIADFAKDLLFEMKFGKDDNMEELGIGKVPIILVVHSMGGLVAKKAYLLGQNDKNYQDIVKSISAIMFLATPHRGTNLAEWLNRLLAVSLQSQKNFIDDLNKSSPALEDLNEQFRHVAPRLTIVSFYEKHATAIGRIKLMVLEKESAILGYEDEISKGLEADHHDVCKYTSQEDPNYISVRNILKSLVEQFRPKGTGVLNGQLSKGLKEIQTLFAVSQAPEDDFNFFRERWMSGTCEWVLSESSFQLWFEESSGSRVAWLNAPPASGKSILSTHIVDQLKQSGHDCQYYFFRFGDQTKRSSNALLRSIGFQTAKDVPAFRELLTELSSEGLRLENTDARIIWQRIFISILFKLELSKPLYWVIDALDEADSAKILPDLLQAIPLSKTPIRILVVSRKTEALSLAFDRLSSSIPVGIIHKDTPDHNTSDIRAYVDREMKYMRGSEELKHQITESILNRADGNFLWVHLVLEEISGCHTEQDIRQTLEEIPAGMNALYERMELSIVKSPRLSDRVLAKTLISWTICAQRPLTLNELSRALRPEFPDLLDLKRTIQDVCGQFIVIDQNSLVLMVHQTARDYLTKKSNLQFSIDHKAAHGELFTKTISFLLDHRLRSKLGRGKDEVQIIEPFLLYAATYWTSHLRQAATASEDMLTSLVKFLKGPFVLTWIHSLALFSRLEALVKAARVLTEFVSLHRKLNVEKNPLLHRLQDLELLELWAFDFVKILGKFGRNLLDDPTAIHKMVPAFCPKDSITYRQFNRSRTSALSVSGISNATWDDCLARLTLPNAVKAWKIICAGRYFAVLSSTGVMFIWDSFNFEEVCSLRHGEHITAMSFNGRHDKFVSYGLRETKIWAVPSGQLLDSTPSPANSKGLAINFAENDSKILVASDDKLIRHLYLDDIEAGWEILDPALLRDISQIDGGFITSPCCMAFNADATQIAVAYRGYPLSVWATDEPRLIGRCKRVAESRPDHARPSVSWMAVDRVTWNPITGHLLGIYKDGCIFKWNPVEDENQEARTTADEIEVSQDGKLFVTSDSNGTVKVWNFDFFTVVYQLSSENLVSSLAFSPDRKRFYDLRGSSINVWEPNRLVRLFDADEDISDTASHDQRSASISQASEAWVLPNDPICALAASPGNSLYCAGHEDGAVDLLDKSNGMVLELAKFPNFSMVEYIAWGDDGKHVAAADLGGSVIVKHLISQPPGALRYEVQSVFTGKVRVDRGGIRQILLNPASTLLLSVTQSDYQIWSIETGAISKTRILEKRDTRKWVNHPLREDMLLGFGPDDLSVSSWNDFTELVRLKYREDVPCLNLRSDTFDIDDPEKLSLSKVSLGLTDKHSTNISVSKVLHTQDEKHILVQISEISIQGRTKKRLLIFETSTLEVSFDHNPPKLFKPLNVSDDILRRVDVPLGILAGRRLVFLDKDLWMCSFRMNSIDGSNALKRHYFIPRDWASTGSLEQCCMMEDGTFLYPKDGEVAVITSDLGAADW